ncbi:MAG: diaminopimelate epimerase [Clostridia bacterium]|nr:diaminopimelate epimerase [Clostridia bacterium]
MQEKREIDFHKYHALGNDYLVIDPNSINFELNSKNIRLLCHRNLGIGADGILYGPVFDGEKIKLRIFNPDGSEAEKSGNGLRIFAKFLVDAGYVLERNFKLDTLGGEVGVEVMNDQASLIEANMGKVTFKNTDIPALGEDREVILEPLEVDGQKVKVICLSIGNPHCVIPFEEISRELAYQLGPQVENHKMFPNRINMQLLKVINRKNIQIEIWERGAGYTLASGSSSSAAASAAYRLGLVDDKVKVHMPGGKIDIEITGSGEVYMTGAVTSVSNGRFLTDLRKELGMEGRS